MITDAPSPPGERVVREMSRRPNPLQRLRNVWAYRELLGNFVRKELKVKYKNSILGFLWSLVNPLLYLVVFSLVFKEILRTNVPYFAIFLLSGLLAWNLFSTGVNGGTVSITGNASLVQRVWFPREILPLASIGAALVHFFLQFLVLIGALLVFRRSPDWPAVPALLLARGPWDHGMLHGGAVSGLVGWAIEGAGPGPGFVLTRLTVELWHPVPLAPLELSARPVRRGRRVAVVDAEVRHAGRVLVRASGQWALASSAAPLAAAGAMPVEAGVPERPRQAVDPADGDIEYPRPGFNCDAAELRPLRGSTEESGPGTVWARLLHPVVAGFPLTPLQRAATLSDLGAAVGWEWSPRGAAFINPDVTLQLVRYPRGEWVCLDSRTSAGPDGVGMCETVLWDDFGRFGRVLQSQVESPYTLGLPTAPPA